jgi:antitoxin component of RelBE/YafQ-DinJ toxin-antitoxin module
MSLMVICILYRKKKIETGIDDSTKSIADKIADLMGLKRCSL